MDYKSIYLKPISTAKIKIGTKYQATIPDFIKPESKITNKNNKIIKNMDTQKNEEIGLTLKESN
jgi:hypothetical protein